jgi:DNA polymerase-3 subunit epsilon
MTASSLRDKPIFHDIYDEFLEYIADSPLIIHNAPFDIGFLKKEFGYLKRKDNFINNEIIDSLKLARKISPGKRNTLDALCERYSVDNSDRNIHGALLDARLLAYVYLKLTIGQNNFNDLSVEQGIQDDDIDTTTKDFKVIKASSEDVILHESYFK